MIHYQVGFALDQAIYHAGPLQIYMSKATGDVKSYDGSGDWFKISEVEADIDEESISWPDEGMAEYTFDIPESTRKLHLSLHFSAISVSTLSILLILQMQPQDNTFFELSR